MEPATVYVAMAYDMQSNPDEPFMQLHTLIIGVYHTEKDAMEQVNACKKEVPNLRCSITGYAVQGEKKRPLR